MCNHTACSQAYNMDQYDYLNGINSQVSEQKNRSLRKFTSRLAKMSFATYLRWLELWFAYVNLKEQNVIKQPF